MIYPVADVASSYPYAAALPRLTAAVAGQRVAGAPVLVTGATILASGGHSGGTSVLAETLLAGAGALVVLAVVFGSLVAITPLIIVAVAIPSAFVFIYALTYVITVSTLVQNIVALVGLGVAIDYALLIVTPVAGRGPGDRRQDPGHRPSRGHHHRRHRHPRRAGSGPGGPVRPGQLVAARAGRPAAARRPADPARPGRPAASSSSSPSLTPPR